MPRILLICLLLAGLWAGCATRPGVPVTLPARELRVAEGQCLPPCAYYHGAMGKANLYTPSGIARLVIPGEPERSRLCRSVES